VALNLKHQTAAQLAARFRDRFRFAKKEEAARMATWLLNRIDDGTFTDTQVRNAFGLTSPQYTSMKTRLEAMRSAYNSVAAAVGE
jgi:hypothetical protein